METDTKDVWMTLKTRWCPQPRWLSAEAFEPACLMAFNHDKSEPPTEELPLSRQVKQKAHQYVQGNGLGWCRPSPETTSRPTSRNRKRKLPASNVVDLRPRLRDEMAATKILIALCAACEAHAAGEDELLMARIKTLYHLFDDTIP